MEAGTARTHLENCTGKTLEKQLRSGRFQSEAKRLWNSQIRLSLHLNSLRNEVAVEATYRRVSWSQSDCGLTIRRIGGAHRRQDQAKKSAGWMPRH